MRKYHAWLVAGVLDGSSGWKAGAHCSSSSPNPYAVCNTLARNPEGDEDDVVLRIESGDAAVRGDRWAAALLAAAGPDPFALVERAVERAAALSGALPSRCWHGTLSAAWYRVEPDSPGIK